MRTTEHIDSIERNFSKAHASYESAAAVQRRSAEVLLERIKPQAPFESILEIGCGSGVFTRLLAAAFPKSGIFSFDVSGAMIEQAREHCPPGIEFVKADAHVFDTDRRFDLVCSNAALHWCRLDAVFDNCRQLLVNGGRLECSVYGPESLVELGLVMEKVLPRHPAIPAQSFLTPERIGFLLRERFANVMLERKCYTIEYQSVYSLLSAVKATGTGAVVRSGIWTRGHLKLMEEAWRGLYGAIKVSYDVIYCSAIKE
jgi:malonyl-CoA O-methyltransferase